MESQFGIANVWIQGDFVTRAVAILLLAMSLASWIVILIKALDIVRFKKYAQAVTTFWHSDDLADGLNRLGNDPSNPFRQLAIEGREGGEPGNGNCPNCDAPISGRFCSNCGQHSYPNRKLTGVLSEFMYGLWNFDTKAWRTIPMLIVRPGTLTRNYVYGKRARYLAPLTMFLFAIFVMFFALSTIKAGGLARACAARCSTTAASRARPH